MPQELWEAISAIVSTEEPMLGKLENCYAFKISYAGISFSLAGIMYPVHG